MNLFISDMHLGEPYAKTAELAVFLARHKPQKLYLIGDTIDGYALRNGGKLNQGCVSVLRQLMEMIQDKVDVTYLIGNHDDFMLKFLKYNFTNVRLTRHAIHHAIDGRKLLVLHGDLFDHSLKNIRTLYYLGYFGYKAVLRINSLLTAIQRLFRLPRWSLAKAIKSEVKRSVERMGQFQRLMIRYTQHHKCDGIILGHTHNPEIKQIGKLSYYNCGDWIDSCTAIIEHDDGRFELVQETAQCQQ